MNTPAKRNTSVKPIQWILVGPWNGGACTKGPVISKLYIRYGWKYCQIKGIMCHLAHKWLQHNDSDEIITENSKRLDLTRPLSLEHGWTVSHWMALQSVPNSRKSAQKRSYLIVNALATQKSAVSENLLKFYKYVSIFDMFPMLYHKNVNSTGWDCFSHLKTLWEKARTQSLVRQNESS